MKEGEEQDAQALPEDAGATPVSQPTQTPAAIESTSREDQNREADSNDTLTNSDEPEPFEPISWEASEYIHHERDGLWAIGFIAVTVILLALAIFLMQSYTFAALIIVMAAALGIYAKRPPHVLRYSLSSQGLHVGQKFHSFNDFRAFGLLHDGALYSVMLFPTARFAPATFVYFPEENGEEIVDILASYLPMEDVEFDLVDNLLRRLRL